MGLILEAVQQFCQLNEDRTLDLERFSEYDDMEEELDEDEMEL